MWPGRVPLESITAKVVANAGTSLSMARNVQLPCPLMVLCTWAVLAIIKILTGSAILKGTATISTKEECAWDSGSAIVPDIKPLMLTQVTIQCPGSLLKKFPMLRLRS